jgi:hypothetical protein
VTIAQTRVQDRPALCTPASEQDPGVVASQRRRAARQPFLGFAGLLAVVPVAALLIFGVGGSESSVRVGAPIVTCALSVVVMVGFWWDDWPGTVIRPRAWSGWIDTAFIVGAAIVLTLLAQVVVGRPDLQGIFESSPGVGHAATFPAVLPLAGAAFTIMLELTLVFEGWPLRRLPRVPGGLVAIALSWLIAVVLYHLVVSAFQAPDQVCGLTTGSSAGRTSAHCCSSWAYGRFGCTSSGRRGRSSGSDVAG